MSASDDRRYKWWSHLVNNPATKHHKHLKPTKESWIKTASGTGPQGIYFKFRVKRKGSYAEVTIDRRKEKVTENYQIFEELSQKKEQIESSFGKKLEWVKDEGTGACRISARVDGGDNDPEEKWSETQDRMIESMEKLITAIEPLLKTLKIQDSAEPEG